MSKPYCITCKTESGPFAVVGRAKGKLYHRCRDCERARRRRYYYTEKGRQAILRANKNYMAKKKRSTSATDWSTRSQASMKRILSNHKSPKPFLK